MTTAHTDLGVDIAVLYIKMPRVEALELLEQRVAREQAVSTRRLPLSPIGKTTLHEAYPAAAVGAELRRAAEAAG